MSEAPKSVFSVDFRLEFAEMFSKLYWMINEGRISREQAMMLRRAFRLALEGKLSVVRSSDEIVELALTPKPDVNVPVPSSKQELLSLRVTDINILSPSLQRCAKQGGIAYLGELLMLRDALAIQKNSQGVIRFVSDALGRDLSTDDLFELVKEWKAPYWTEKDFHQMLGQPAISYLKSDLAFYYGYSMVIDKIPIDIGFITKDCRIENTSEKVLKRELHREFLSEISAGQFIELVRTKSHGTKRAGGWVGSELNWLEGNLVKVSGLRAGMLFPPGWKPPNELSAVLRGLTEKYGLVPSAYTKKKWAR